LFHFYGTCGIHGDLDKTSTEAVTDNRQSLFFTDIVKQRNCLEEKWSVFLRRNLIHDDEKLN
jgi:hypothetical protein